MKRFFTLLVFALSLSGCEDILNSDMIIDWYPIVFNIKVVDAGGRDMLDPSSDNSWVIGTTMEFKGKRDTVDQASLENIYQTRDYLPRFDGIRLVKGAQGLPAYFLKFAEFDGSVSYDNEKLTITWPDGRTNIITYTRKFNALHTKVSKETFKLDGAKCSNPIIIVR